MKKLAKEDDSGESEDEDELPLEEGAMNAVLQRDTPTPLKAEGKGVLQKSKELYKATAWTPRESSDPV